MTSLIIFGLVGFVLLMIGVLFARTRRAGACTTGWGACARSLIMARQGLAVLRRPVPALGAAMFQLVGWLMQLLAVWAVMEAFNLDLPLPAAGLVLVLMNVAIIFPLWPGNIGLLQAAVALPLVQYGVPYGTGLRVRARAAGGRDVGRRRRRPHLPRPRGALARIAEDDGGAAGRPTRRRSSSRRTEEEAARAVSRAAG